MALNLQTQKASKMNWPGHTSGTLKQHVQNSKMFRTLKLFVDFFELVGLFKC